MLNAITNMVNKLITITIMVSLFVIFATIATLLIPVVWCFLIYRIMTVLVSCVADDVL